MSDRDAAILADLSRRLAALEAVTDAREAHTSLAIAYGRLCERAAVLAILRRHQKGPMTTGNARKVYEAIISEIEGTK